MTRIVRQGGGRSRAAFRAGLAAAMLAGAAPLGVGSLAVASLAVASLALAPAAHAQSGSAKASVDQAKAQGVVGEQADGFLGFVGGGDPSLHAAVAEINAGRASAYREAAARSGVTPAAAAEATARQLEARLPSGQYFRSADGRWERR